MRRNPDAGFVLHGRRTPIGIDKPKEYLTNSQRTISTRNLSQNTLYQPDSRSSSRFSERSFSSASERLQKRDKSPRRYQRLQDSASESVFDAESLFGSMNGGTAARLERREQSRKPRDSEFSLDFTGLGNSLSKSLNKSVSFSKQLEEYKTNGSKAKAYDDDLEDTFEEELQKLIDDDIKENERFEQDLAGKPKSKHESEWFTEPVHLTKTADYPVFQSLGVDTKTTSPVNRTAGMLGTELAQQKVAHQMLLDDVARQYFPVTLGEMPSIMRTVTPQPPNSVAKKYAQARSMESASRSTSNGTGRVSSAPASKTQPPRTHSSHSSTSSYSNPKVDALCDYNYLRASKPFVEETVTASPYQYELAQLKMERLRLEEQRLLESKRQEELERIRGPTPKWYELKSPQFTYELHKNNKLLQSKKDWQNLMDYREQLTRSSQDFAKTDLGGYLY
ncbi:uncharacterized protein LOC119746106 [Patiria miniata]|uniref:Uncharacterized protein n=1 Tax=Patiria miniata TaxID=46514 RepID=A0A914BTE9_PATMI|nr:uncharacterized protein LOC119746106 [Patiria miniata]